jgi:hypothetical protein
VSKQVLKGVMMGTRLVAMVALPLWLSRLGITALKLAGHALRFVETGRCMAAKRATMAIQPMTMDAATLAPSRRGFPAPSPQPSL